MPAMEGGIEAGNLRQVRLSSQQRTDRGKIVGLMERRQANVLFELRQYLLVDQNRPVIGGAAMNDTVTNGDRIEVLGLAQPATGRGDSGRQVRNSLRCVGFIDQDALVVSLGPQARARADAVDLTLEDASKIAAADGKGLEFKTGGTGIDDKDRVHGTSRGWLCRSPAASIGIEDGDRAGGHAGPYRVS